MKRQSLAQKRAEVAYRNLMSEQHRGGKIHFSGEYTQKEMLEELRKRLANSRRDFKSLQIRGVSFTPYLEIGAEYGLRSALLKSEFKSHGIALDIAITPLQNLPGFANKFRLNKIPLRVCADCHALPFPDNSFRFIFCYQTLHHFPNPLPVIREIYRCLIPGGYFFFAEEPIFQKYNLDFFRRPTKITGLMKLLKTIPILPFVSKIGKTETDFGIYEGTITLDVWRKIISMFKPSTMQIDVFPFGKLTSSIFFSRWSWEQFVLDIFGGGIQALLQKPDTPDKKNSNMLSRMIRYTCPDCKTILIIFDHQFQCRKCKRLFTKKNGVWEILPIQLHTSLA